MKRFTVLIAIVILSGCTSANVITGTPRAPISEDLVKVYSQPPAKYEEIAILTASSQGSFALTNQQKMNEVVEDLKKEAAKLGANGVLLSGVGSDATPVVGYNANGGTNYYGNAQHKTGQAVAIYVPE